MLPLSTIPWPPLFPQTTLALREPCRWRFAARYIPRPPGTHPVAPLCSPGSAAPPHTAVQLDDQAALLTAKVGNVETPVPRACSRGFQPKAQFPASKPAGAKGAASCPTPKLRFECQQGSGFRSLFKRIRPQKVKTRRAGNEQNRTSAKNEIGTELAERGWSSEVTDLIDKG
jgi:hypothetical protein